MKYKLIKNSKNDINNFLETVLLNRNITDIDNFRKSNTELLENNSFEDLDNIEEGVELLIKHMKNKSKTTLIVDPDLDGITSSTILYNYLKEAYKDISFITPVSHSGKGHGLSKDVEISEDTEFIIIPDAGSNDYSEIAKYHQKGIDILIIDHHIISNGYSPFATVINNQESKNYSNKDFSGVGVVYRFLQALDDALFLTNADNYLDLVAIGLIADIMDTTDYETRYYIQQGLLKKHLKNPYLKQLLKLTKQADRYLDKYIIISDVAFGIVPAINATMRFGTAEEKLAVFKCFTSTEEELQEDKFGKRVYDMCIENKTKQNEDKALSSARIIKTLTQEQIKNDKILIINATGILDRTLTGITAMELAAHFKRPVLIGTENNGTLSGSIRNYSGFPCEKLKTELAETGLFTFLEGHEGAAGYSLPIENIQKVIDIWNEKYKDIKIEGNYDVDFILDFTALSNSDYYLIDTYRYLWGTGVPEPLFAIVNIPFYPENIKVMGTNKDTAKYEYQGKSLIKFHLPENDELLQMAKDYDIKKSYIINVVGKVSMNHFAGRTTPQIMLEDYDIIEVTGQAKPKTTENVSTNFNIWSDI